MPLNYESVLTSSSQDSVLSLHSSLHLPERIGLMFPHSVWLAHYIMVVLAIS